MAKKRIKWINKGLSVWVAELDGVVVGGAGKGGTHLDDYPWDWYLTEAGNRIYESIREDLHRSATTSGVAETLRSAKSYIRQALGLTTDAD